MSKFSVGATLDTLSALSLTFTGGLLLANLARFRQPDGVLPDPAPRVAVLVPARNEAQNIEQCVRSLLAQNYPALEIIVLDDQSEDGTGEILARVQAEAGGRRLQLLQGQPLPTGWAGKNWACHQLAQAAAPTADYLLFTDADTTHAPDSLARVVAEAERDQLALLSLMPQQTVLTGAEQAVVPLLSLQILGYLPLWGMENIADPRLAAANGQYILVRHDAYRAAGGHAANAGEIAEDVMLARAIKKQGRVRLASGAGLVQCRMYRTHHEIVGGFRRSFASGFRIDRQVFFIMLALNFSAYWLPFLRAPLSQVARGLVVIILLLRLLLAWHTQTPWRSVLMHPVGMGTFLLVQAQAAVDTLTGRTATWKGRSYSLKPLTGVGAADNLPLASNYQRADYQPPLQ